MWQLRTGRDILAVEVPSEEWGIPPPDWSPQPGTPGAGKRSPHKICLWKPVGIAPKKDKGLLETEMLLLKSPCTNLLAHNLTCSKLQHKCYCFKNARNIQGGTKITNFKARAKGIGVGATLLGQNHLQVPLFLCRALLPPSWPDSDSCQICILHYLG